MIHRAKTKLSSQLKIYRNHRYSYDGSVFAQVCLLIAVEHTVGQTEGWYFEILSQII